jgi:phage terminase large subunit-like protein
LSRKAKDLYSVPDFTKFCDGLVLDSGRNMKLEAFQRTILRPYFNGVTETVVIVPKKNGKTTLLAALALYHLRKTEQAECVIAAASRDQAEILFNQAAKMIRASNLEDEFVIKSGYREIRYRGDSNWTIRVLAADANTADGVIPTLALVDELHRHRSAELYGVFADGLGPRNGQIVTISTAGSDPDTPLGRIRDEAYEHGMERVGPYRCATSADGGFVLHEWALDESQDVEDLDLVAEANPASWQTATALAKRRKSPSMTPYRWKRFACGIWTDVEEPWIAEAEWDACKGELKLEKAPHWTVGIDIGQVFDSSAVVTVGMVDGKLHVRARIWHPQPGKPVAIAEVEAYVMEVAESGRLRDVAYDPMRFNRSAEVLEERGLKMVEFPQTHSRMVPASNSLYDIVREGNLVHDGDPDFKRQVMAGVAAETDQGWRISKKKSRAKIDALIALALGADLAWQVEEPKRSVYEERYAAA